MTAKVATRGLSRVVGGTHLLDDVSIAVAEGEVFVAIGPSGSGKSTLLRLLCRLDEPTDGTVLLDGVDYREFDPRTLRRRVGLVGQRPALVPGTVDENVALGPRLRDEPVDSGALDRLLRRVDLDGYAERDVSELSGGEAQRVSIARTVMNGPEVLLLDEPTSSLDAAAEARVESLIEDLIDEYALTCVVVTHDRDQARRLGDRGIELRDGRVSRSGAIDRVIA